MDSAGAAGERPAARAEIATDAPAANRRSEPIVFLGFGGYLPERVVTNAELVEEFPEISAEYVYQVTGIRERRWAGEDEKPSGMAYQAALEAIRRSGVATKDIDAVIVATTTPDMAMPSTAAILQDRLNLQTIPAFDLNAACSGWLYAVSVAQGLILAGTARNVLTVGVDMQSRLLDKSDRSAYFLFGDGAGAAIVSSGAGGHRIHQVVLGADTRGLHMARREEPGRNGHAISTVDSDRRARAVPLRRREFHRHHPQGDGPQRLERRRHSLDHSPPSQRPDTQGRRQAQRRGFRAVLPERRARGQHLQRKHPDCAGRGGRKPRAGRQIDSLFGRRRHDHRGHFG